MKARYMLAALALLVMGSACGDNLKQTPSDGGITEDVAIDAPIDASIDAPQPQAIGPCLDRPTDLPRPRTGALSCDLLPPGFVAEVP